MKSGLCSPSDFNESLSAVGDFDARKGDAPLDASAASMTVANGEEAAGASPPDVGFRQRGLITVVGGALKPDARGDGRQRQ